MVALRARMLAAPAALGPPLRNPLPNLFAHQIDGIRRLIGHPLRGRALLCDEPGLGKTATSLGFAREFGGALLVLCPAGLQRQWAEACSLWLGPDHGARIVSYDALHAQSLDAADFGVVVADEAHYIKDRDSRRAKAAVPLIQRIRRALLLTGTPMPNRPVELWCLLVALRPRSVGSYWDFARRYGAARRTRYGIEARGASNVDELQSWLRMGFMVRRTQEQLGLDLPTLTEVVERVDLPDKLRTRLASLEEELEDSSERCDKLRLVSAMFAETARAKQAAAAARALELASADSPLIVFVHHKCMMQHVAAEARAAGWRTTTLDGSNSHAQKHAAAQAVQAHAVDVAVFSLLAAGTGLNLTGSHRVLFAELYWVPAVIQQAKKRVHRIGQTRPCTAHVLVARDTCDERVLRCLSGKVAVQRCFDL